MAWARRGPRAKRTATGTGMTQPPWHRIVTAPSAATPRTACGKGLRGPLERAASRPDDGPACPECVTDGGERSEGYTYELHSTIEA